MNIVEKCRAVLTAQVREDVENEKENNGGHSALVPYIIVHNNSFLCRLY